jgi:hypothetical protein
MRQSDRNRRNEVDISNDLDLPEATRAAPYRAR